MGNADSALPLECVAPVGVTGDGRADRPQKAHEDGHVRRRDPAMGPPEEIDDVEEDRERPGPDRNIGEDRVKRMAEPGAVDEGLEIMPGLTEHFVCPRDDFLEGIGDRLEPALPVDELVNDVIDHRRLLCECGARQNSMGLQVELEPAGHPPPRAGRLLRVDGTEANGVPGPRLGQQWEVGIDDGRNHRVTAGGLVIDVQDDQSP